MASTGPPIAWSVNVFGPVLFSMLLGSGQGCIIAKGKGQRGDDVSKAAGIGLGVGAGFGVLLALWANSSQSLASRKIMSRVPLVPLAVMLAVYAAAKASKQDETKTAIASVVLADLTLLGCVLAV
jgi:hypothetical protein